MWSQEYRVSYRSLVKQKELIPLIQTCVTTTQILCYDGWDMRNCGNNNCAKVMSDVVRKLDYNMRGELAKVLRQDEDVKLKVLLKLFF